MAISYTQVADFSAHHRDASYCNMYVVLQVSPNIAFTGAEATD